MNKKSGKVGWALLIGFVGALQGCAMTTSSSIPTAGGNLPGMVDAKLAVTGLIALQTDTGNLPGTTSTHFVNQTISIPLGTAVIMPSLNGWLLSYGSATTNPTNANQILWNNTDHNWGFGRVSINVIRINPPTTLTNPPSQTAEISVAFHLADKESDENWFGSASYHLLCLGEPSVAQWRPLPLVPFRAISTGR